MAKMILCAARMNRRLSQKQAAKKLNVSNKTLGNWESGKTVVPANKIDDICNLYGCTYDEINFLSQYPV